MAVSWIKIQPTEANSSMELPPCLSLKNGILIDTNSPHVICKGSGLKHAHCCHVYIPGTGSNPSERNTAMRYLSTTANDGMTTIGLSYQWGPYPDLERNALLGELQCDTQVGLINYHRDIVFGGSSSGIVNVSLCNSIIGRLTSLISHLAEIDDEAFWSDFLDSAGSINFSKFIFSGHSQGAGHVCYLAKFYEIKRAVLMSGPQEALQSVKISLKMLNSS